MLQRVTAVDQSLGHCMGVKKKSILLFYSLLCIAVPSPPLLLEFQLRHLCSPLLEQRMCLMETADGSVNPGQQWPCIVLRKKCGARQWFIVPRPASNNSWYVLRLLTQPCNLQNSSVWAGFCSSHFSTQVLWPGWPCLIKGAGRENSTSHPLLWAES